MILEDREEIGCDGIKAGNGRTIRREEEVWARESKTKTNFIEIKQVDVSITNVTVKITGVILS